MFKRKCVICNTKFKTNYFRKITCSTICSKEYRKVHKKKYRNSPIGKVHRRTYNKKYRYSKNKQCICGRKIMNQAKKCCLCTIIHGSNVKRYRHGQYNLHGSWEVKFVKYLDKNKIKWQYEPKTFKFKNYGYTPDFYLPESDTYIEIKGYWYNSSKRKYNAFKRKFGNIILLNKQRLKKLGII